MYSEARILRLLHFLATDVLRFELYESISPMFQRLNGFLCIYHAKPVQLKVKFYIEK